MRFGTKFCISLFVLGAIIALVQMWFVVMPVDIFFKVEMTLGIVFVVTLVLTFFAREAAETKRLRDGQDL
jgi:hypothetical protein